MLAFSQGLGCRYRIEDRTQWRDSTILMLECTHMTFDTFLLRSRFSVFLGFIPAAAVVAVHLFLEVGQFTLLLIPAQLRRMVIRPLSWEIVTEKAMHSR